MKLCVLSNKPLDEMEKIVTDIFSQVNNKNIDFTAYDGMPFDFKNSLKNTETYKLVKIVPVQDEENIFNNFLKLFFVLSRMNDTFVC